MYLLFTAINYSLEVMGGFTCSIHGYDHSLRGDVCDPRKVAEKPVVAIVENKVVVTKAPKKVQQGESKQTQWPDLVPTRREGGLHLVSDMPEDFPVRKRGRPKKGEEVSEETRKAYRREWVRKDRERKKALKDKS